MTFTFDPALATDRDYVRWRTADTEANESYLPDELIAGLLAQTGSKQAAAVAGARFILLRMAQPRQRADWLEIDPSGAVAMRRKLLEDLISELDISANSLMVDHVFTYRADSAQTDEPDYFPDGRP